MIPSSIANKLLNAFFQIGGSRQWHQRGSTRHRLPADIQRHYLQRAEEIRAMRRAKRLNWRAAYAITYYRASALGYEKPTWEISDLLLNASRRVA